MRALPPGSMHDITESQRARFWARVDTSGDCWLWTRAMARGYGVIDFRLQTAEGRVDRRFRAHRLAFYLATGEEPGVVRHTCDNPPCVNPAHLLAGTQIDNIQDAVDRQKYIGRHKLSSPEAQALMHWTTRLELGVKWCPICKQTFGLGGFNKNRAHPDGHMPYCRSCQAAKKADYLARRRRRAS